VTVYPPCSLVSKNAVHPAFRRLTHSLNLQVPASFADKPSPASQAASYGPISFWEALTQKGTVRYFRKRKGKAKVTKNLNRDLVRGLQGNQLVFSQFGNLPYVACSRLEHELHS
jgi:hypothetical protein